MNRTLQVLAHACLSQARTVRLTRRLAAQDINIQNMNIELVAQMFKNYQSNVLFHLEGMLSLAFVEILC